MFEVDAFYYSLDGDLTSSIQRQSESTYDKSAPLWKKADERFFWNHFMLSDLLFAQVRDIQSYNPIFVNIIFNYKKINLIGKNMFFISEYKYIYLCNLKKMRP